jgi:hypothetical protein
MTWAGRSVAKGHRQVAAPALIADAADGAAFGVLEKLASLQPHKVNSGGRCRLGRGLKSGSGLALA